MADAAAGLPAAAAAAGGGGGTVALLAAGASQRLAVLPEGGPHSWGAIVLAFWLVWLCMQAPWRALLPTLRRNRPAAAAGRPWRRDPAALVLRTFAYGAASALLWVAHLDPQEFRSWEDVYFFCGRSYQHCTAGFRWNGGGWVQAFVLWNFVLSSALLLQKFVVALGLGGLLPGEDVVTRESFVSIAWRLVPYWLNQWEQQWGAECSSMLFELPHFALELLVVLPCVQIFCGRLRVMAQPHIRDPLPAPAADGNGPAAGEGWEAAEGAAGPAAEGAAAEGAAGAAGGPAAAAAAAEQQLGDCWVPDVMRCRWRRDPAQRRLLPRLKANLRSLALSALIIAVAASNSLLVPLALEARPAASQRANQILRFKKELSFLVATGRHADTALWYQRLAAASAQTEATQASVSEGSSSTSSSSNASGEASGAGHAAPVAPPAPTFELGSGAGGNRNGEGAAGFLAAVLEGSSNSSRLDAKLAVWSTLWQPLLPPHWLRAVLAADASQVSGLNPAYLSALQFVEHAESAELAQQLHAAANNPRAWSEAQAALQHLLPQSGDSQAGAGIQLAELLGSNTGGREATVRLLLMGAIVGGIDAKSAPLRLKPTAAGAAGAAGLDAATRADVEWMRNQQALYAAKADLPGGLLLAGDSQGSGLGSGGEDAAGAGRTAAGSASSGGGGGNGTSAAAHALHLSWQQQQRMAPLYRLLHKHCTELERMRSADHRHLIPLVELSLAIMRLSCERFFSLLAVFLGFLAFRDPPPAVRRTIRIISLFASVFQRLVLYSFPAICWAYGAGALFSSFVSIVFWTGPLVRTVERMRSAAVSVQPRQWHHATHEEVERMGRQCAICWGDMSVRINRNVQPPAGGEAGGQPGGPPAAAADVAACAAGEHAGPGAAAAAAAAAGPAAAEAAPAAEPATGGGGGGGGGVTAGLSAHGARSMALQCGHAFHRECLQQWLQQCYGQGRGATCPMCQATIPLRVRYRLPFSRRHRRHHEGADGDGPAGGEQQEGAAAAAEGIPGLAALVAQLQDDFRARFEPMLDVPAGLGAEAEGQQWPPPEAVLLPPDWPEGDLLLEEAAAEAAAAMVAAAAAAQMPPIHAANVMAGAAAEAEPAEAAAEAEAAATLQQAIEAVEAAEQLLQQHNPAQQAQQAEQAQQPGQQADGVQPQPQPQALQAQQAQQPRRLGLFGRLLRRRRGNG